MNLHVRYLLLGGGLAAATAAEGIRAIDADGSILLVGQEVTQPYHRPPLSKEFLLGTKRRDELHVHKPGWYAQQRVECRSGERAAGIDTERRTVTLDTGEGISFDKLLIATGGVPRHLTIPGAELANVYYLRTMADVDRLHHAIDKAKREGQAHPAGRGKAAVIGAGALGVEIAATLTSLGLNVTLVGSGLWPWSKFAGETTGKLLGRYLEAHGISNHMAAQPTRFDGDGRVQRVVLSSGDTVACDFVVPAVGMTTNKDLLRGTPIAAERAILVDKQCRTNVPDIYAAGDCAAVFDPLFGKHRVLDHWDNAQVTGKLAGRNMAGAAERYDAVNYFFSDVFDLSLSAWGESRIVERRLVRGVQSVEKPDLVEIGVAIDGRIAQVLAIGHAGEDDVLRELVHQRISVDGNEELLKDPKSDLRSLLK